MRERERERERDGFNHENAQAVPSNARVDCLGRWKKRTYQRDGA